MLALSPPELLELLKTLPADRTAFVWGPPGIGKSALVRGAGQELGLPCVVLLGTQLAPEDLIGVPRIRELAPGRFATEFCPPSAILRAAPFLLFVDELNSAIPDVQKAFYSLILDRRLGDYELPTASRTARSFVRWQLRSRTAWCTLRSSRMPRRGSLGPRRRASIRSCSRSSARVPIASAKRRRATPRPPTPRRAPGTCYPTRSRRPVRGSGPRSPREPSGTARAPSSRRSPSAPSTRRRSKRSLAARRKCRATQSSFIFSERAASRASLRARKTTGSSRRR